MITLAKIVVTVVISKRNKEHKVFLLETALYGRLVVDQSFACNSFKNNERDFVEVIRRKTLKGT